MSRFYFRPKSAYLLCAESGSELTASTPAWLLVWEFVAPSMSVVEKVVVEGKSGLSFFRNVCKSA